MTDLALHLERLGLEQYIDAFIGEGFDTWETLCDVQERDLEHLNVRLGHRRKLQRAIADYRGIPYERLVGSPAGPETPVDIARLADSTYGSVSGREATTSQPVETKRKYRRHPKPDENAPEKPPSAYVLFSNKTREEVKSQNLSFTEIAKLVGDRWQKLESAQKAPFETAATSMKEQYNGELSAYKKTDAYKEYTQYLSEFKAKHGVQTETKRPKLDPQSSGGSLSTTSVELADAISVSAMADRGRVGSIGSQTGTSLASAIISPTTIPPAQIPMIPSASGTTSRGLHSIPRTISPQSAPSRTLITQLSSQSSASDDSSHLPYDSISRTATLSLNTPPGDTPPPSTTIPVSTRVDQASTSDAYFWPSSRPGQPGTTTPSGPSPLGSGITLPSPTKPHEPWRDRPLDWPRQLHAPPVPVSSQGAPHPFISLLGSDRMSDFSHGQVPRILPPLRQNPQPPPPPPLPPQAPSPTSYQSISPASLISRQEAVGNDSRYPHKQDNGGRPLDRNENEAANTLAGLAARPGNTTPQPRTFDRRRP